MNWPRGNSRNWPMKKIIGEFKIKYKNKNGPFLG